MKAAWEGGLVSSIVPNTEFEVRVFSSKSAMLLNLPGRLKGLKDDMAGHERLVILIDEDREDCVELKNRLLAMVERAGLGMRSDDPATRKAVVRIVVEELEAWFLGDVPALCAAYPRVPAALGKKAPFRDPDAVKGGTWERLQKVLQSAGVHKDGLAKVEAARAIAPHMDPKTNRSGSFQSFRRAVQALCGSVQQS